MSNNRNVIVMGKAGHFPSSVMFEGTCCRILRKEMLFFRMYGLWTSMGYNLLQTPVKCLSMEESDDFSDPPRS